ncbi:hypothetical protein VCHA52P453_150122 [Vibrio chagasii]|nr:hypothetical protein VCHA52P453_150122 [Vibrio chagasii]
MKSSSTLNLVPHYEKLSTPVEIVNIDLSKALLPKGFFFMC